MRNNPDMILARVFTYTSPAGLTFPVMVIEEARERSDGKAVCLPIGHMPLEIDAKRLTLGAVL